ncbi:MAG: trehalase family glycosidase [bacterium]
MNSNYTIVHEHIKKIMPILEKPPMKGLIYPYLSITHGKHYADTIFCWDNHHMAMRFAYSGKPEYFKYLIDNVLHYQGSDGYVPNCIHKNDGPSCFSPRFHAQPFLMQGALMYLSQTNDLQWIKKQFIKLKNYLKYYETHYKTPYNLFRWPVSWMGGIDNDVVTTFFQPDTIIPVDINAWIYLEYRAAAILAGKLNKKGSHNIFHKKAKELRININNVLWYDEVKSYSAYNLCTGKHQFHYKDISASRGYYAFQSCSNLIPLYARIPDEKKARLMIQQYVINEEHFLSPYGIRSLSKSSEYYNNAVWGNPPRFGNHKRLTNSNWQGPVWIPLSYFMFHALLYYGFKKEAKNLADRTLYVLASSIKKIGSFTENYHAETGVPLYASEMASWDILADIMNKEMDENKWIMNPVFDK